MLREILQVGRAREYASLRAFPTQFPFKWGIIRLLMIGVRKTIYKCYHHGNRNDPRYIGTPSVFETLGALI